jgi:mono/diheme cytochrome c family protein
MATDTVKMLIFSMLLIATNGLVPLAADIEIEAGKTAFGTYCAACHGVSAKGDGPVAAQLVTKPSDLTKLTRGASGVFPHDSVRAVIDGRTIVTAHGGREMPVWGDMFVFEATGGGVSEDDSELTKEFVAQRINQLTSYIASIQE